MLPAALLLASPSLFAQSPYLGASGCRMCHPAQLKSWEQTRLAKAFDQLKPGVAAEQKVAKKLDPKKDYTHDAACLGCHVTGYGQPGGFESIEKTPALAGITCEACHGPGGKYLKPNLMSLQNNEFKRAAVVAAGLVIPTARTCETCHNARSPFFKPFDFAARKNQAHQHVPLRYPH